MSILILLDKGRLSVICTLYIEMNKSIERSCKILLKIRNKRENHFRASQRINLHTLTKKKRQQREKYYSVLCYFVNKFSKNDEFTRIRLTQYHEFLVRNNAEIVNKDESFKEVVNSIIHGRLKWWRKFTRYLLLCDIALILLDEEPINKAHAEITSYLNKKQAILFESLRRLLYNDDKIPGAFLFVEDSINQFRANYQFIKLPEKRFLVTANVSAGKSTLINAIIGKPVTKAAQEPCTANVCYLYNKPFEDNAVHLLASHVNLNATFSDLTSSANPEVSYIAAYFRTLVPLRQRVCIIDTPGVNSAINRNHGELTRKAITEEKYDKLIYVLNANTLGVDDEIKYLKYVYENVPNDKIIFVLNKLDCFKASEDSIVGSIEGVKADLQKIGYENPTICPLSAYFSFLLKMKKHGGTLNKQEERIVQRYIEDFSEPEYDLSAYYDNTYEDEPLSGDEFVKMCSISGLYGLENILYGGIAK